MPARRDIRNGDVGGALRAHGGHRDVAAVLSAEAYQIRRLGYSPARDRIAPVSSIRTHIQSPGAVGRYSRIRSRRRENDSAVGADIDRNSASYAMPARGSESDAKGSVALQS